ncbi:hypothetical protein AYI68_g1104 [Smittium mucronatum]|uniref:Uncharacterized protein n=1 Tax=Smittium mucronatum TaxID=133383 RepID=A0A1R0H6G0_9FUNG|nr:hypothetical protein AYI68_g1104 [Smittium mucronatum]
MEDQDDSMTYSNRAATDYTGGSRYELDTFSDFGDGASSINQSNTEFYQDAPLKLDFDQENGNFSGGINREIYRSDDLDSMQNHNSSKFNDSDANLEFEIDEHESEEQDDWSILTTSLINEKGSPELLVYRKSELENLGELVQFQIEKNVMWYATVAEASKNLSPQELEFAKRYQKK